MPTYVIRGSPRELTYRNLQPGRGYNVTVTVMSGRVSGRGVSRLFSTSKLQRHGAYIYPGVVFYPRDGPAHARISSNVYLASNTIVALTLIRAVCFVWMLICNEYCTDEYYTYSVELYAASYELF